MVAWSDSDGGGGFGSEEGVEEVAIALEDIDDGGAPPSTTKLRQS